MSIGQEQSNTACVSVMKVVGDYWTMAIIKAIGLHQRRFCEIERIVPDSNPVTLTSRLKKMESLGLLIRSKDPKDKVCVYYALTAHGKGLIPIAKKIEQFAESFNG